MKIESNEGRGFTIKEVFNPIILETAKGEILSICMRDSGFEFGYSTGDGTDFQKFFAKEGYVEPFKVSARGNYLVEQKHEEEPTVACKP